MYFILMACAELLSIFPGIALPPHNRPVVDGYITQRQVTAAAPNHMGIFMPPFACPAFQAVHNRTDIATICPAAGIIICIGNP